VDTAKRARVRFGVDVDVVPAGPGDPGPDPDPSAVAAVRERYGPYFLYVGALEPRKALDTLVAAHRGLAPALVLAGDGRLAAELAGPGVHLTGRVGRAEKAALYAGALAVVLPSWWEGYGYPPLEGFAHGIPAIVSDLPALHETAGDGACYVAPGDVDGLRAALEAVASDQELRRRLADGGAAALRQRSWEKSAVALRAVLEEAAA
jgi:glycosyltransferase involved in cell wall biosynthesis